MESSRCVVWIAALCCLVGAIVPAHAALVGLWRFEEGSGLAIADSSGNGTNGSLSALSWDNGANDYVTNDSYAPSWVAGKYGTAVEFDPTYADPWPRPMVYIPNASTLNLTESFTIAAWMWFESSGASVNAPYYSTLFTKVGSYMFQGPIDGDANYYVWENSITPPGLQEALSSAGLPLDQWVHVAFVYDFPTTTLTLYYDGAPVASHGVPTSSGGTQYVASNGDLFLGHYPFEASGSYERSFSGKMDDVAFFNSALETSDIATIMTGDFSAYTGGGPIDPPESNIVGLWRFDEGSGTTAEDSTIYGNDGTLRGFTGALGEQVEDSGALPTWVTGQYGGALQFSPDVSGTGADPSVYMAEPQNNLWDLTTEFTFMCWAKVDGLDASTAISKYPNAFRKLGGYYFQFNNQPGDTSGYIWQDYGEPGVTAGATLPTTLDDWAHYTWVFDNGTMTTYVNGAETGQTTGISGTPTAAADGAEIGRDWARNINTEAMDNPAGAGRTYDYHGALDDVALFDGALSPEEIGIAMGGDFSSWLLAQLPTDETDTITVEIGDDVTLTVPYPGDAGNGDFTWTFTPEGGSPSVIVGETDATLLLADVQMDDSGTYEASYDNGAAKVAATYTVTLNVVESLPVGSIVGFGAVALGLAAAAAGAIRRKK